MICFPIVFWLLLILKKRNETKNRKNLCVQQRLQDMDYKIDELRDQIDTVVTEKCLLEKQTQIESEVIQ